MTDTTHAIRQRFDRGILKSDWKTLQALRSVALDRLSKAILDEIAALAADETKSHHERYLAVWQHVQDRDRDVADGFNEMTRSKALMRIAFMRRLKVMTDEEFTRFSDETREAVGRMRGFVG
ncbi:MAG: peptide ABC transporter substrate-binding protein [Rhizomicrobium sp.]